MTKTSALTDTELTRLLAEKVMGWTRHLPNNEWFVTGPQTQLFDHFRDVEGKLITRFDPLHPTKGYNDILMCWRALTGQQKRAVERILMPNDADAIDINSGVHITVLYLFDATPRQIAEAIISVVEG